MTEAQAQTALLNHVKSHCCWGLGPARHMTVSSIRDTFAYHVSFSFFQNDSRYVISIKYLQVLMNLLTNSFPWFRCSMCCTLSQRNEKPDGHGLHTLVGMWMGRNRARHQVHGTFQPFLPNHFTTKSKPSRFVHTCNIRYRR